MVPSNTFRSSEISRKCNTIILCSEVFEYHCSLSSEIGLSRNRNTITLCSEVFECHCSLVCDYLNATEIKEKLFQENNDNLREA